MAPENSTVEYRYPGLDPGLEAVEEPSDDELRILDDEHQPGGTENHMLIAWRNHIDRKAAAGAKPMAFQRWKSNYITVIKNRRVGPAFEDYLWNELWKLAGSESAGWIKGSKIDSGILPDGPVFDITNVAHKVPPRLWTIVEAKSGDSLASHARSQFKEHVKMAGQTGSSLVMMFGRRPSPATQRWIKRTLDQLRNEGVTMPTAVCVKYWPTKAVPEGPGGPGGPGGAASLPLPLGDAPDSPEDQAVRDEIEVALDQSATPAQPPAPPAPAQQPKPAPIQVQAGQTPPPQQRPAPEQRPAPAPAVPAVPAPQAPAAPSPPIVIPVPVPVPAPIPAAPIPVPIPAPAPAAPAPAAPAPQQAPLAPAAPAIDYGGIDFSTLELRYVTDTVAGKPAMQYAFRASTTSDDVPSYGGKRNAQMAMDAFYVWMALSPDKFWVNLNPTEPDRIIDQEFGKTQAGQVLLEADLEMKEVSGRLQRDDTPLGKRFEDALRGTDKCFLGRRQWIEPTPATVREDGDQLYIIDAPLTVKVGLENSDISPNQSCDGQDPAITAQNGKLYQDMIMPAVVEAINKDPEFADLRRVYASRIAAEWYRKRNADKPTQYADVIDSGNVAAWTVPWNSREVFDRYVYSYTHAKPTFSWKTQEGDRTWTRGRSWGGVDFSKIELKDVGEQEFKTKYASIATAAGPSIVGPVEQQSGDEIWLADINTSVPLNQIWPQQPTSWTPYDIPNPATSRPFFYVLVTLPVAAWLVTGGVLWWRRRKAETGG
ncbi:hypothetical protein [Mycolicibacterium fortuitum]|uniref:Uncharacterized protein n=2 Tax=Mycolicibacterium fortuitum TaxID=1766 RepID=A0AAE4VI54_MYCFO|nr:hypothetical protein [Mycolicibacterium fortuitum]MCA4754997.1 hypothetical protein [Mycolicibacterium fortuitum]MCV7140016.1 hypothetical protein [Mycolicibacterium fortuitum]MDV7194835.1 hypothetical protein [Mycolicibacterium fortuitum]MDV7208492.1 hypothetical protein [Mycolicibacterium fortuitum]MDV7230348.1 hypothetical protein [Mycolicibacterium fortuitum]